MPTARTTRGKASPATMISPKPRSAERRRRSPTLYSAPVMAIAPRGGGTRPANSFAVAARQRQTGRIQLAWFCLPGYRRCADVSVPDRTDSRLCGRVCKTGQTRRFPGSSLEIRVPGSRRRPTPGFHADGKPPMLWLLARCYEPRSRHLDRPQEGGHRIRLSRTRHRSRPWNLRSDRTPAIQVGQGTRRQTAHRRAEVRRATRDATTSILTGTTTRSSVRWGNPKPF